MPADKTTGFDSNVILEDLLGTPAAPGPYFGFQRIDPAVQSTGPRIGAGNGDPSGILTYPTGSIWIDALTGLIYRNTGAAVWTSISGGSGAATTTWVVRSVGVSGGILATDAVILVTAVPITLTLPSPATVGQVYAIKDTTGTAETNAITLARFGAENIEGLAASRLLQVNFGSWRVISDGTNWWLLI